MRVSQSQLSIPDIETRVYRRNFVLKTMDFIALLDSAETDESKDIIFNTHHLSKFGV